MIRSGPGQVAAAGFPWQLQVESSGPAEHTVTPARRGTVPGLTLAPRRRAAARPAHCESGGAESAGRPAADPFLQYYRTELGKPLRGELAYPGRGPGGPAGDYDRYGTVRYRRMAGIKKFLRVVNSVAVMALPPTHPGSPWVSVRGSLGPD
eukprot:751917-Hanusia_phi.AAC.1